MDATQKAFFEEIIARLAPGDVATVLEDLERVEIPSTEEERAIHRSLTGTESYAFLWRDLVSLSSIIDAVNDDSPDIAQRILRLLLNLWIRMRAIRVRLSEAEAKVLLAVKRGADTAESIIAATKLTEIDVNRSIMILKQTDYLGKGSLLESDKAGKLSTRF